MMPIALGPKQSVWDSRVDMDFVRDLMIHDLDILLSMNLGRIVQVQAAGVCR